MECFEPVAAPRLAKKRFPDESGSLAVIYPSRFKATVTNVIRALRAMLLPVEACDNSGMQANPRIAFEAAPAAVLGLLLRPGSSFRTPWTSVGSAPEIPSSALATPGAIVAD